MRAILLVAFAVLFALPVFAQPDGYAELPIREIPTDHLDCRAEPGLFDGYGFKVASEKPGCDTEKVKFDPVNESVYLYRAGGDCHMSVRTKAIRSDREKKFKLILNVIYGGCRAAGWRSGWVVFEKVPPEYAFEFQEVRVDRGDGTAFVYPKPPAPVTVIPLTVREIDVKDCLPLSGQSQWVLRDRETVFRGFAESDLSRCSSVLDTLKINFDQEMLVGYSFASGYCNRPIGLKFEASKETSADPGRSRFVLKVVYDTDHIPYCRIWRTYPVWVVMPKLFEGYSMDFRGPAEKSK